MQRDPTLSDGGTKYQPPRARVLIVDDTPSNLTLLSDLLLERGYEVAVATNGPRALALAEAKSPDVIMLDVTMPEMSGFDVCRALQAKESSRAIPVLFLSALDDVSDKVAAFRAGGVDYVTKPFQVEEVLARLETQLRLARLTRELQSRNLELARRNDELLRARHHNDLVFSALAELLPGQVLDGKYRLGACIGAGGFGTVFKATHLQLGREVAVKVFRPSPGNDTPLGLARFRAEGATACRVDHPNVVAVLDSGISDSGIAYLVMELLLGHTLAVELTQRGALSLERTLEIAIPLCRALAEAASKGIVHRDIKPSNVFLHVARGVEVVKVVDFGIAKLLGEAPEDQPPPLRGDDERIDRRQPHLHEPGAPPRRRVRRTKRRLQRGRDALSNVERAPPSRVVDDAGPARSASPRGRSAVAVRDRAVDSGGLRVGRDDGDGAEAGAAPLGREARVRARGVLGERVGATELLPRRTRRRARRRAGAERYSLRRRAHAAQISSKMSSSVFVMSHSG